MNTRLTISKIYIEETKNNVKVCSKIKSDKEDYILWFEIENEYKKYIIEERADAFLVALLPYAIKHELDIYVENSISSKLYYQLTTYLIPMLCDKFEKRQIDISCNSLDNKKYNTGKAVGTAISRGVDSLYTIAKHTNLKTKEFNITHLTLFNAGATGQYGGDKARELYNQKVQEGKKFAKENEFDFVSVDSNMNEFLMMSHTKTHTFRTTACILLLQKLFSKYYFSSTYDFNDTRIDAEEDIAHADVLMLSCLSTEDITFYPAGIERNRIGKVKELVNYKPSYNSLNVCIYEKNNCGFCTKCMRTIMELYSIGKLDLYKNVFDIDKFYKNKSKYFLWLNRKIKEKDSFCIAINDELKKRNIKKPVFSSALAIFPTKSQIKSSISKTKIGKMIKNKIIKTPKINDGWTD